MEYDWSWSEITTEDVYDEGDNFDDEEAWVIGDDTEAELFEVID